LELLQADGFKERAAREQLELKKEGEVVVRFQETRPEALAVETTTQKNNGTSNYEKWLSYFFKVN
jgi:hypothetical protein